MKNLLSTVLAIGALATLTATAQEASSTNVGNFKFSIGTSYRNFHTARQKGAASQKPFDGFTLANPTRGMNQVYDFSAAQNYGRTIVLGQDRNGNVMYMPEAAYVVHSDGYSSGKGGDYGFGESFSKAIEVAFPVYDNDRWDVCAFGTFQYFDFDAAFTGSGSHEATFYETTVSNGVLTPWNAPEWETFQLDGGLAKSGRTTFNMQMYEFDLGLRLGYTVIDNLDLHVGTGPTLTIADMESSNSGSHSNGTDWLWGWEVSAGAGYMFSEVVGISLDIRYDEVFNHASTKYVNMNLDSWSTMFKVMFVF